MPFRARVKRALGRNSESDSNSLKSSKTNDSSIYYTPSEMPKPKFRGPVDPAHKALMESFSFKDNWGRRNSAQSQYSPFGSKLPTRNNSFDGGSREPWALHIDARKRYAAGGRGKSGATHVETVDEADDEDATNVSGSRAESIPEPPSSVPSDTSIESNDSDDNTFAGRHFTSKPFTEADFNHALKKSMSKSRGQD